MSLEFCFRCNDTWNTAAGYHICPDEPRITREDYRRVMDAHRGTLQKLAAYEAEEKAAQAGFCAPPAEFVKHDQEKPVYALLDPEFEAGTVRVLTKGSRKYADENWKLCKTPWRTYYSALRRHLEALARGEYLDPETQEPHWYHISCCTQFLAWFHRNGLLVDWPGNRSTGDGAREGAGGGGTGGHSVGEGAAEPRVGDAVDEGPRTGRPLPY